jgi:hypothetical protein
MRKFGLSGKRCPFDFWNGLCPSNYEPEILKTERTANYHSSNAIYDLFSARLPVYAIIIASYS